jgi:hypothetical protein
MATNGERSTTECSELERKMEEDIFDLLFNGPDAPFRTHPSKLETLMLAEMALQSILSYVSSFILDMVKDNPGLMRVHQEMKIEWSGISDKHAKEAINKIDED